MVETLPGVKQVELSSRLVDSPAIVVGHESASKATPCIYTMHAYAYAYTMQLPCNRSTYNMHITHTYAYHANAMPIYIRVYLGHIYIRVYLGHRRACAR
jgi:hypothetical protein